MIGCGSAPAQTGLELVIEFGSVHAQTIAISFWSESAPLELVLAVTSGSVGAHSDRLANTVEGEDAVKE